MHSLNSPQLQVRAAAFAPQESQARLYDIGFLAASLLLLILYHIWYYSWRFTKLVEGRGYTRVDITGQRAREIFVRSIVDADSGNNADAAANIALQATRNPITAVSILATGTTVGATTLTSILLDLQKMEQVRQLGRSDPFTGASTLFSPELKVACSIFVLFLAFFSLAQSLRLFIHFSFFIRAARWCVDHSDRYGETTTEMMIADSCKTCLRAQTYNSLGFRFMYCFIPSLFWLMGGTYMLLATVATVIALYNLDQI